MRSDKLYLTDIVDAADAISSFVRGRTKEEFLVDDFFQSAVLQKFGIIGEAAGIVSDEMRHQYPFVPWQKSRGLRNAAVHRYFAVDWEVIWDTAIDDVPVLREQVARILEAEFPGGDEQ